MRQRASRVADESGPIDNLGAVSERLAKQSSAREESGSINENAATINLKYGENGAREMRRASKWRKRSVSSSLWRLEVIASKMCVCGGGAAARTRQR